MRIPMLENPEYIVNLTNNLVGKSLGGNSQMSVYQSPSNLFAFIKSSLQLKIRAMSSMTLGRICDYGCAKDSSHPLSDWTGFIRLTGLNEVLGGVDFSSKKYGRDLLEEIAMATIASVAFDIVWQDEYESDRQVQVVLENFFDGDREFKRQAAERFAMEDLYDASDSLLDDE